VPALRRLPPPWRGGGGTTRLQPIRWPASWSTSSSTAACWLDLEVMLPLLSSSLDVNWQWLVSPARGEDKFYKMRRVRARWIEPAVDQRHGSARTHACTVLRRSWCQARREGRRRGGASGGTAEGSLTLPEWRSLSHARLGECAE
jgi:hypothetical protein